MTTDAASPPLHGHRLAVRRLTRACNRAALATAWREDGRAYVSLVAVATDIAGAPLLLLSQLSDHTRNITADPRVSLLFDGTARHPNPQEGPRATILGRIAPAPDEAARRRYLARHPGAAMYAGFGDFAFYRVEAERVHWVGGFGRAAWLDRPPLVETETAAAFAAAESAILSGTPDRLADRIAARAGRRGAGWRLVALDPDGCDIARGRRAARIAFPATLNAPAEVEAALAVVAG